MSTTKFSGDLQDLKRSAREEREKAEDDATAQVDGRKLRKYSARKRDKMLGVRLSQDHRAKLERLARARRMNFTQIIEEGIDLVHARTKGR
jgi:hypothetical protein